LAVLAERAVTSRDYFRKSVSNRRALNPISTMPPHPTFDDDTFNALEAYFQAMLLSSDRGASPADGLAKKNKKKSPMTARARMGEREIRSS
jgi:hypothetical protein